jgi:CheY-like chemotaxis protein
LTYIDGQVTFALSPLIRGISLARKILLADDSVTAQNMGRKILADAGYEVIAVNNGSAALKKIAELKPDLVILDVYMPGYSGLEVCQRLKESPESARIPVLLSVGKLEPFKPEEAQRVRADGYIVKPFEASELLSALAKLEDKVVPRSEPSKPGRFARAIAAAEEVGRGNRKETAGEDTGWKSRIAFPHAKTESEEKVADDSAIYNPMNRDLRTVVETPLEKAAEKLFQPKADAQINEPTSAQTQIQIEEKPPQAAEASTTSVDVAAAAGLPKDVTPEEVAAIAAAVAQIQMAEAALKGEHSIPDSKIAETTIAETTIAEAKTAEAQTAETTTETRTAEAVSQAAAEPPPQLVEGNLPSPPEVRAELASSADETQDVPVTMAVAGESKWSAVPVRLEGEEATVSLDQEMQKAYAAFAAAVAQSSIAIEEPVPQISTPEAVPAPPSSPEPAVSTLTTEAAPFAPSELAADAEASSSVSSDFQTNQLAIVSEPAHQASQPSEAAEEDQGSIPIAQFMSPVSEAEVANLAARRAQDPPAAQAEVATPETMPPTAHEISPVESVVLSQQHAAESKTDPEVVKNTAAAWANWREAHDTSKSNDAAQVQPRQFEAPPEPVPGETAARAVAAGAEQFLHQAVAAPPSGSPSDVASIVDSVLADLRPKLMEEISRKMAEKK